MLREAPASTPARLVLEGVMPGATPEQITAHFTDPARLTTWWPAEVTIDESGTFAYRWPAQDWTLRGKFLDALPGHRVRFTWARDHEPLVATKSVLVTATWHDTGSRITITHGDYGPDDAGERSDHAAGWQHFAARLAAQFV